MQNADCKLQYIEKMSLFFSLKYFSSTPVQCSIFTSNTKVQITCVFEVQTSINIWCTNKTQNSKWSPYLQYILAVILLDLLCWLAVKIILTRDSRLQFKRCCLLSFHALNYFCTSFPPSTPKSKINTHIHEILQSKCKFTFYSDCGLNWFEGLIAEFWIINEFPWIFWILNCLN